MLVVTAFAGSDLGALREEIRRTRPAGAEPTAESSLGTCGCRCRRPPTPKAIARLAAVHNIEELGEVTLNNETTTWQNQTT